MARYQLIDSTTHSLAPSVSTRINRYGGDVLAYIDNHGTCTMLWNITQIRDCHEVTIQDIKMFYCHDLDKQLWYDLDQATLSIISSPVLNRMAHVDVELVTPLQHRVTGSIEYLDASHPSATPRGRPYKRHSGEIAIHDRLVHYRYYQPVVKTPKNNCVCNIGP